MTIHQLNPHTNMTTDECLAYCHRSSDQYQDVIVIGYDKDGDVIVRSSHMSRAEAVFMLLAAIDHARAK